MEQNETVDEVRTNSYRIGVWIRRLVAATQVIEAQRFRLCVRTVFVLVIVAVVVLHCCCFAVVLHAS